MRLFGFLRIWVQQFKRRGGSGLFKPAKRLDPGIPGRRLSGPVSPGFRKIRVRVVPLGSGTLFQDPQEI